MLVLQSGWNECIEENGGDVSDGEWLIMKKRWLKCLGWHTYVWVMARVSECGGWVSLVMTLIKCWISWSVFVSSCAFPLSNVRHTQLFHEADRSENISLAVSKICVNCVVLIETGVSGVSLCRLKSCCLACGSEGLAFQDASICPFEATQYSQYGIRQR